MKKVMFVAAFAAASFVSQAQTMFGIQGGANFSNIHFSSPGDDDNTDTKVGFLVGAVADIDFGNGISFRPELNYIQKGGLEEETEDILGTNFNYKTKYVLGYAQLAPNFVYNFKAGSGKFFVGVGPDFSLGISGRIREKVKISGNGMDSNDSEDTDIKFDGDDNDGTDDDVHLKSFDFGVNGLAGYKMANGLFFNVGYTLGLSNIDPAEDDDFQTKNRGFNVKIGYMFGGKKK